MANQAPDEAARCKDHSIDCAQKRPSGAQGNIGYERAHKPEGQTLCTKEPICLESGVGEKPGNPAVRHVEIRLVVMLEKRHGSDEPTSLPEYSRDFRRCHPWSVKVFEYLHGEDDIDAGVRERQLVRVPQNIGATGKDANVEPQRPISYIGEMGLLAPVATTEQEDQRVESARRWQQFRNRVLVPVITTAPHWSSQDAFPPLLARIRDLRPC